jgi:hypothetical protein
VKGSAGSENLDVGIDHVHTAASAGVISEHRGNGNGNNGNCTATKMKAASINE